MHNVYCYITVCDASSNCKSCINAATECTSCETEAVIPRYLMGTACVTEDECPDGNFWNTVDKICERKHR